VFLTTISLQPGIIKFTPDAPVVLNEIGVVLDGVVNIAQQAPRLLFMRAFAQYFEGKPSGLNPLSIIRSTPDFVQLRSSILDTISADFTDSRDYVKVRPTLCYCVSLHAEPCRKQNQMYVHSIPHKRGVVLCNGWVAASVMTTGPFS
jgi:hypothetical protein